MVVATRQTDSNTVELTITSTGKAGDNVNLPDGLPTNPFNGPYSVNWGDQSAIQVVAQNGANPTVVTHDYVMKGSFRGYVEGDARIRFHALSS